MPLPNQLELKARPASRLASAALLALMAFTALLWLAPLAAEAGVSYPTYPLVQIRRDINFMPGLTPDQRANWRAVMLPAARRGLVSGLDPLLVTDLAKVALRRGAEPWTFRQIIDRLIVVHHNGGDTARAARRLALRHYYASNYNPLAPRYGTPGGRLVWVDAADLRNTLDTWRGAPYHPGGTGLYGVDRCGLVQAVFGRYGLHLPRSLSAQSRRGVAVGRGNLRLGDLLVFELPGHGLVHVGIYISDGFFLHADPAAGRVRISHLNNRRFARMTVQGRRLVALAPAGQQQARTLR